MRDRLARRAATILAVGTAGFVLVRRRLDALRRARFGRARMRATLPDGPGAGALALIDVDDLKGLNVREGFDVGDRLLDATFDVLRRAVPPGVELERTDGGRFIAWMPPALRGEARAVAERLRVLASETIVEGAAGPVSCNVSAGTVAVQPSESRSRAILRADFALARAKGLGGGRTEQVRALPPRTLMPDRADVEAAIAARDLEYHVQPIVALADARPVGVEALIRWRRDGGGVIGPAGFLDTLNRIPEAGSDLFPDMAVEAARPFVTADDPLYVTFNVTGAVLDGSDDPGARWLAAVIERIPSDRLVLEVLETAVIVEHKRALAVIERLRARGVRFALDDFGTGLSNLERVRRFPFDILKIDRAFVDVLDGEGREAAILDAMVTLAGGLGIDLVAEGVETGAQVAKLREFGVRFGQGYHFGRPAAAGDWAQRLAGRPAA